MNEYSYLPAIGSQLGMISSPPPSSPKHLLIFGSVEGESVALATGGGKCLDVTECHTGPGEPLTTKHCPVPNICVHGG